MRGYIQIYTGNGKGKTTAALGLALRALGAGMRVFIGQFMKCGEYSELRALRKFEPAVTVRQYGMPWLVRHPGEEDIAAARKGLAESGDAAASGEYGLVILDEVCTAIRFGILPLEDVLALTAGRHGGTELVLTGRDAPDALVERADLVTEMREVKHYYHAGIPARKGIEE